MNVDFILNASGNVTMGRINHAIFADSRDKAKQEAQEAVAMLHKAGYFIFTLYDTSRKEVSADVEIARFTVEELAPLIIVK
jgi:hypothetical protein